MPTVTIRGIDEDSLKALKERAKREGRSVNAAVLTLLREALGLQKKRPAPFTDLDHLAGTWSKEEYKEFQKRVEDFEKIDEGMWK